MLVFMPQPAPQYVDYGGLVWKWVHLSPLPFLMPWVGYWYSETDKFLFGLYLTATGSIVLDVYAVGAVEDKDRLLRVEWSTQPTEVQP